MLVRTVFWLTAAVMLLPTGADHNSEIDNTPAANSPASMAIALSVVDDLSNFCDRNNEACIAMVSLGKTFGVRLRAHTENIGNYLANLENPASIDPMTTSTTTKAER